MMLGGLRLSRKRERGSESADVQDELRYLVGFEEPWIEEASYELEVDEPDSGAEESA